MYTASQNVSTPTLHQTNKNYWAKAQQSTDILFHHITLYQITTSGIREHLKVFALQTYQSLFYDIHRVSECSQPNILAFHNYNRQTSPYSLLDFSWWIRSLIFYSQSRFSCCSLHWLHNRSMPLQWNQLFFDIHVSISRTWDLLIAFLHPPRKKNW